MTEGENIPTWDELWLAQRPRLLAIAYNILGTWAEAEDVVSEAWLILQEQPLGSLHDPPAWLTVVTSRIALDSATSAARARTEYIGPWLPEILLLDSRSAAQELGPEEQVVLTESVDLALVRMVQALSPVERVILVLVDVFRVPFREVARVVGQTPAATRQRAVRARRLLEKPIPVESGTASSAELQELAEALSAGDLKTLVTRLSDGCVLWTDSDGRTRAARRPVSGAEKVARFLTGIIGKFGMPQLSVVAAVGGSVLRASSADLTRIVVLEMSGGLITGIQIQQNPAKMRDSPLRDGATRAE